MGTRRNDRSTEDEFGRGRARTDLVVEDIAETWPDGLVFIAAQTPFHASMRTGERDHLELLIAPATKALAHGGVWDSSTIPTIFPFAR